MIPLSIGVVAPITHRLPPEGYGPWEQVASDLSEGLVAMGHRVTLFAAAGSSTSARLVETCPRPLVEMGRRPERGADGRWHDPGPDPRVWEELHVATAMEAAASGGFDVVHSHLHVHALPFARLIPAPLVTTLHGSAWNRAHHPMLSAYRDQPFVSISDAERAFFPGLRYLATVHNGIRVDDFEPGDGEEGFLLFAGRMAPEKAPELAVEVAERAGIPLKLAGPIEEQHRGFFDDLVRPRLAPGRIEYLGPLTRGELAGLYPRAAATLMPLRWDEPFGLVVVESLASGTPVVAWRRGAMPELVRDGVTGFLVETMEEAVAATGRVGELDRRACRSDAESRFSVSRMSEGYSDAFTRLVHSMASSSSESGTTATAAPRSEKP